ncbi:MAG: hypothetical protein L3K17_02745 [Thermoplasmata archaeon]|nr:hypothetical protein [Thermoplasmata archaeon]
MNGPRIAAGAFGILGLVLMTGMALGGAAAMSVPSPGASFAAPPTSGAICSTTAGLHVSTPVAGVGQLVVFSTYLTAHPGAAKSCPGVASYSYSNLPAGVVPGSCSSASLPSILCVTGAAGLFPVTVTVHLSNGVTVSAMTNLFVVGPTA